MNEPICVNWDQYDVLVFRLYRKLSKAGIKPDYIIGLATGGVTGANMLKNMIRGIEDRRAYCAFWSAKNWPDGKRSYDLFLASGMTYTEPPPKNGLILLFDDLADSGDTLAGAKKKLQEEYPNATIITSTLWYKTSSSFVPDYFVDTINADDNGDFPWIEQPFEETKWQKFMKKKDDITT